MQMKMKCTLSQEVRDSNFCSVTLQEVGNPVLGIYHSMTLIVDEDDPMAKLKSEYMVTITPVPRAPRQDLSTNTEASPNVLTGEVNP